MEQPPNNNTTTPINSNSTLLDKTSEKQVKRDENGRILPGYTANKNGRPKGSLAFKTALERWANENAGKLKMKDGTEVEVTALELVTRKLVEMAMEGDIQAIREVSDRMDGKAKQSIDHTTDGLPIIEISAEIAEKYNLLNLAQEQQNDTTPGTEENRGQS